MWQIDGQRSDKLIPKWHFSSLAPQKYELRITTRQSCVCETLMPPAATKLKFGNISKSHILTPPHPPGACGIRGVWATLRWTYSQSLISVWPSKLEILHFLCKRDGITDRRTNGRTHRQMDDPITRCPQGHKKVKLTAWEKQTSRRYLIMCISLELSLHSWKVINKLMLYMLKKRFVK